MHAFQYKVRIEKEQYEESLDKVIEAIMGAEEDAKLHCFEHIPYVVWYSTQDEESDVYKRVHGELSELEGVTVEGAAKKYTLSPLKKVIAGGVILGGLSIGAWYVALDGEVHRPENTIRGSQVVYEHPLHEFAEAIFQHGENYGDN